MLAVPCLADAVNDVRQAEIAFAKAFADRDAAKFFSFVADDATFFGPRTLGGKKAVVEQWSRFFNSKEAPFSWTPERNGVNAAGTIGWSTGPVFGADGKHGGNFNSVWVKQPDGSWKVLFDGGGPAACFVETEGFLTADDGVKLHYRKAGQGPTTLIIPLGFALHDDFKSLADVATVITYDPRNRGRSQRVENTASLTIQNDVRDLEAVRSQLKVEKFVPVGYSYLGLMVAMYAAEHPDRVTRMIQLGPVPRKFATEYPKELTHGREDIPSPPAARAPATPREACEAEWSVIRYVLVGNAKNASRVTVPCDLENEWPVNLGRHLVQKTNFTGTVNVPVLVIHGTFDRNAPYGSGREWARTLPNARLLTVPGAGHQSWSDEPAIVFSAIRQFIRGDWPPSAE
jgi:pimeloyl-ACP methyl ester carboxylesterase/ketosteroid isomerase-like protein